MNESQPLIELIEEIPVAAATDEVWQEDLDLKLYGAIRTCRLAIPHLREAGGLLDTQLPDGSHISAAALPIEFDGKKAGKRSDPPAIGAQTRAILQGLGYDEAGIAALTDAGVVRL